MITTYKKKIRPLHELAEKIRELNRGIGIRNERSKKWNSFKFLDIKHEENQTAYIYLAPERHLAPVTFYQPVIIARKNENNIETVTYRMPVMERKNKEQVKIHPVLISSKKKVTVKRKKKRSTTYSRIEEILSRGKHILLLPDPSEESIGVETKEETEGIPMRNITNLPEDILQKIFWHFNLKERCTILSIVCKTWYYIVKNPVFWRHLEFRGDEVPTNIIIGMITKSPLLSSLKLISVPNVSQILQELCRDKTEMKELSIRYCVLNSIDSFFVLVQIINSLPNLEVLDLQGTEFQSKRFFTELCLMGNLKSLNLGGNRFLHPRDLMTISVNCRGLETLKVLDIPWNAVGNEKLTDENFSFIVNNLQCSITHLEHDMQKLGNSAYLAILQCKKLRTLCLTNCLLLTGEMFRRFNQLEQLKELTLTLAINLSSEDFEYLFAGGGMRKMESLNISGCWRITEADLKSMKGLSSFNVSDERHCIWRFTDNYAARRRSKIYETVYDTKTKVDQVSGAM